MSFWRAYIWGAVGVGLSLIVGCGSVQNSKLVNVRDPLPQNNIENPAEPTLDVSTLTVIGDSSGFNGYVRVRLSNAEIVSGKRLSQDFENQVRVRIGNIDFDLTLNSDQSAYQHEPKSLDANQYRSLFNAPISLMSKSGVSLLSGPISVGPAVTNFENIIPSNSGEFDLDNCFGATTPPTIKWAAASTGQSMEINFNRETEPKLSARYTSIVDSGSWNEAIRSRDIFTKLFTDQERNQASLTELSIVQLITRSAVDKSIRIHSAPERTLTVRFRNDEERNIIVSFVRSCAS